MNVASKIFRKLKFILLRPVFWLKRYWAEIFIAPKIKAKIGQVGLSNATQTASKVALVSSFRTTKADRMEIFKTTMAVSLKSLDSNLNFYISDASPENFAMEGQQELNKFKKLVIRYSNDRQPLTEAYSNLLNQAQEQNFCIIFDDQPIVGLTNSFLESASNFLEDFKNLVDVILIENLPKFFVNHPTKQIQFNLKDIYFHSIGVKPLGVVKYGNYSFAIFKNFHYGFFFNTLVGRVSDYSRRLEWYKKHISSTDVHKIELAGMSGQGPIYNYIAIPCEVFMINLDFSHTEISIRDFVGDELTLFQALKDGYEIEVK